MKNVYALLSIFLLFWTTSSAQTTEIEPNNSFNQANAITLGNPIKLTIGPGDEDYFKITLDKPGIIEVSTESMPADLGVLLRSFNGLTQQVGSANTPGRGRNTYLSSYACSAGIYYIVASDAYISQRGSTTPINMTVTLNTSDPFECNNSFITASEIKSGQGVKAAIHPDGDVDYFKLVVDKPGIIDVQAENLPAELGIRLSIWNSANQLITTANTPGKGKNAYLSGSACNPGTYYVLVEDAYISQEGSPTVFDFKVTLNNTDAFECNNSFLTAREISSGQALKIAIHPGTDEDYFKLNVTKPGVINVLAENLPGNLGVYISCYNSANQLVEAINTPGKGRNSYLNTQVCNAGVYYIKLEDAYISKEGSPTLFDFKVINDTTDIYECNNSFVAAKEIQVDRPIQAAINASGDLDFFKFTLGSKTTLNMSVSNVPASIAMNLVVYNAGQNPIQSAYGNAGTAFAIQKYALDAGTYYVRLAGNNYDTKLYTFGIARDTVLPPKVTASTLTICPGSTIRLTASECTGTVRWSTTQTGLSITVSPSVATNYTAVCEDGGRVSLPSALLAITMKTVPTATASASNSGQYYETQTIQLTAGGGGTYTWRGPNNYTSTLQSPVITNARQAMSGTYTVVVTNTDGCTATASTAVKVDLITSVEPSPVYNLAISPNPTATNCVVKLVLQSATSAQITLLDPTGRTVRHWASEHISRSHETVFSLETLPAGMYLIQVISDDKRIVRKLLKQ